MSMTPEQHEHIDARIGNLESQALDAAAAGQTHQAAAIYERIAGMAEVLTTIKASDSAAKAEQALAIAFSASMQAVRPDPWATDPEHPHH
jgi:excinuclease UvrABC nuclease subunit